MQKYPRTILIFIGIIITLFQQSVQANTSDLAKQYIEQYRTIVLTEMHRTQIPASIKMAQAMFESNFGRSRLAMEGNNHFGIKCKSDWDGATIFHDDDEAGECFRKYTDVEDGFIDHSTFLLEKERYKFLFGLPQNDYRRWAAGLKQAGYATDPNYAHKIIDIIERFELHKLDVDHSNESPSLTVIDNQKPKTNELHDDYFVASKQQKTSVTKDLSMIDAAIKECLDCKPNELTPTTAPPEPQELTQPQENKADINTNKRYIPTIRPAASQADKIAGYGSHAKVVSEEQPPSKQVNEEAEQSKSSQILSVFPEMITSFSSDKSISITTKKTSNTNQLQTDSSPKSSANAPTSIPTVKDNKVFN
ncbi:MAG: glycoside hydrolase family 73 protein [Chitinophagales bacterium]